MRNLIAVILILASGSLQAQRATFVSYNVENLYDTINNSGVDDADFTPTGKKRWSGERYAAKIGNISKVISDIRPLPDIIGLEEIENENPLRDIVSCAILKNNELDYVRFDSRDARGIGTALLFSTVTVTPLKAESLRYREIPTTRSRDILYFACRIGGTEFHILVCHLPSVLSDTKYRMAAARSVGFYADSIAAAAPGARIVVMGDFNANPGSKVMLTASANLNNPFEYLYKKGYGSYSYRSKWSMFDAIMFSPNIENTEPQIFIRDYIMLREGPSKNMPLRTFAGDKYLGGYSDHLPVVATCPLR